MKNKYSKFLTPIPEPKIKTKKDIDLELQLYSTMAIKLRKEEKMKLIDFIYDYNLSYINLIIKNKNKYLVFIKKSTYQIKCNKEIMRIENKLIIKWEPIGTITYYIELE